MKTTFKQYLQETTLPPAESVTDLLNSIEDGKFIKDGSKLILIDFHCEHLDLISLMGAPKEINGHFNCKYNKLTSLIGSPNEIGDFSCAHNLLSSLEGAPTVIGGSFYCRDNKLVSLHNIHKHINEVFFKAYFDKNPIKSHVLGLLKIRKLRGVKLDNKEVEEIINKYLPEGDIFACQQELIDAGFEAYAQL